MPLESGLVTPVITGQLPGPNLRANHSWSNPVVSAGSRVVVVM
jgi:hypothetical protein